MMEVLWVEAAWIQLDLGLGGSVLDSTVIIQSECRPLGAPGCWHPESMLPSLCTMQKAHPFQGNAWVVLYRPECQNGGAGLGLQRPCGAPPTPAPPDAPWART